MAYVCILALQSLFMRENERKITTKKNDKKRKKTVKNDKKRKKFSPKTTIIMEILHNAFCPSSYHWEFEKKLTSLRIQNKTQCAFAYIIHLLA